MFLSVRSCEWPLMAMIDLPRQGRQSPWPCPVRGAERVAPAQSAAAASLYNGVMLTLRRIGIDTYRENVAFLRRDCTAYQAEEFRVLNRIEVFAAQGGG